MLLGNSVFSVFLDHLCIRQTTSEASDMIFIKFF